jgi:transposase
MEAADMNDVSKQLVSALYPKKVVDDTAESITEISKRAGKSPKTIERWVRQQVAEGKVEKVWKRGSKWLVPAYRIKQ